MLCPYRIDRQVINRRTIIKYVNQEQQIETHITSKELYSECLKRDCPYYDAGTCAKVVSELRVMVKL